MASISKVRGVGPAIEKALAEQGFNSAEDIAAATAERLNKVPGIGAASAPRLIAAAKAAVASENPSSDDGARRSEKSKPATEPAEPGKKKAAKPKKKDKKSGRKSKEKADKKGKGKPADKGGKKKSRKGKARRNA